MCKLYIIFVTLLFGFQIANGIESRVFGGQDLKFDVHKYLVKLKIKIYDDHYSSRCSGSIIDNSWIVTAAHCFDNYFDSIFVYQQTEDGLRVLAKVDKNNIHVYPGYLVGLETLQTRSNDIALVKTMSPIEFSDSVQPVKLTNRFPRIGQVATIAGYGDSEADNITPREGEVQVYPCMDGEAGLICSYETVRAGSGDSGGALLSHGRLIGVTSASCRDVLIHKPCMTVYVNVVLKLKWIQNIVSSN